MRDMKRPTLKPKRVTQAVAPVKRDVVQRRTANQIAHVMTTHGKLYAGRKGRKG